jgi:hypothetical protein
MDRPLAQIFPQLNRVVLPLCPCRHIMIHVAGAYLHIVLARRLR